MRNVYMLWKEYWKSHIHVSNENIGVHASTLSLHLTQLMRLVNYSLGLPFNVCLLKKSVQGFYTCQISLWTALTLSKSNTKKLNTVSDDHMGTPHILQWNPISFMLLQVPPLCLERNSAINKKAVLNKELLELGFLKEKRGKMKRYISFWLIYLWQWVVPNNFPKNSLANFLTNIFSSMMEPSSLEDHFVLKPNWVVGIASSSILN